MSTAECFIEESKEKHWRGMKWKMKIETHLWKLLQIRHCADRLVSTTCMTAKKKKKREFEYNKKIDGNRNQLAYIRPDVNWAFVYS